MNHHRDLLKELGKLQTETNPGHARDLELQSTEDNIAWFIEDYQKALPVILTKKEQLSRLIESVARAVSAGKRIFYTGAGTSGRLGVLDASECPPTFGLPVDVFNGIIAGGEGALRNAVEGAEDNRDQAIADYGTQGILPDDVLIGITASSRTPYVLAQLETHNRLGGKTGLVVCSEKPVTEYPFVTYLIDLPVGPELLTGSTRLKSGTLTKIVLNMISTLSMVQVGKVYKNYMVDLKATNEKLKARTIKTFMELTGEDLVLSEKLVAEAGFKLKTALVIYYKKCTLAEAERLLEQAGGKLRNLI